MTDNLYDLSTELAVINDELISSEGEISASLEERLEKSTLDFTAKAENISKWVMNLSGKDDAIDKEIARLQAKKRVTENLQRRLKDYLMLCIERANKTKIELPTLTISIAKNPPSVEIIDEKAIPASFLTIVPEHFIPDKKLIAEALKKGHKVEGCKLITDKRNLRIK